LALNVTPANPFFCAGDSIVLNITGADTYTWSGGAGLSATTGSSVVAQPAATTTYTVIGTTAACVDSTTVTVTVGNIPNVSINAPSTSLCSGDPVTLTATGAAFFNWSPPTGLNTTIGSTVVASPSQATTYTVTGTVQGCSNQASVTLAFEVEIEETAFLCPGATLNLPDGSTTNTGGTYTSNFVTALGCDSTIITEVIPAQNYTMTALTTLCAGSIYTLPDGSEVDVSGTYPVLLESVAGCDSLVTTVVDILPVLQSTQQFSLCAGETALLPDGSSTGAPGVYSISLPSANGCDSTVITTVEVFENYDLVLPETTCSNAPYILPDGTPAPGSGNYPFALTSSAGCDSNVVIQLQVLPAYQLTLNPEICAGSTYLLPNGNQATAAGTYPVLLQTSLGCDSAITVQLTVNPLPVLNLGLEEAYCHYETVVPLSPTPGGGTLSGPTVQGFNLVHNGTQPGTYNVQYSYTDANGCSATAADAYLYTTPATVNFEGTARCSELRLVNLSAGGSGALSYTWRENGDIFSLFPSPVFGFPTSGLYEITLEATDAYGCTYTNSETFDLQESLDLSGFQIPNVITPNDDNWNDILRLPYAVEECLRYELQIFNRWGARVYTQTHLSAPFAGWDEQGQPLSDGLYYFTFETLDFECGARPELEDWCTGTLQILR
jgi:gliding motility-associated-like protein